MRLCMVSDLPQSAVPGSATASVAELLARYTAAWVRQGHEIDWLAPPAVLREPVVQAGMTPATDDLVPATCRYVIPLQAYEYAGVRLLCVPPELWQRADLHTRLFTFLCLLQRARPCTLWHVWGTLQVAYLTVYTARYLALPAVVSYQGAEAPEPTPQGAFLRAWTAQHAAAQVRFSPAEDVTLDSEGVQSMEAAHPGTAAALLALYRRLSAATPAAALAPLSTGGDGAGHGKPSGPVE